MHSCSDIRGSRSDLVLFQHRVTLLLRLGEGEEGRRVAFSSRTPQSLRWILEKQKVSEESFLLPRKAGGVSASLSDLQESRVLWQGSAAFSWQPVCDQLSLSPFPRRFPFLPSSPDFFSLCSSARLQATADCPLVSYSSLF